MDGSGVGTVVSLNNVYTFVFTLDYSQQMLYWMNSRDSCYYTNYIESSSINGSGRRKFYDTSHRNSYLCHYGYYHRTQAIDFFGGAIYSYSRRYNVLIKTEVELHSFNITHFNYVNYYMCGPSYTGMKVISSERQLQGMRYKIVEAEKGNFARFRNLRDAGLRNLRARNLWARKLRTCNWQFTGNIMRIKLCQLVLIVLAWGVYTVFSL